MGTPPDGRSYLNPMNFGSALLARARSAFTCTVCLIAAARVRHFSDSAVRSIFFSKVA